MKRYFGISIACLCSLLLVTGVAFARPSGQVQHVSEYVDEVDVIGDVDGTNPAPQKALQDTVWIADWTFDTGAPCDESGWNHVDNHVLFTGDIFWHVETGYTTTTGMAGNSYAVGYHGNVCCEDTDGYDNDWYQGFRMEYQGTATLSFDFIVDTEAGYDFLQIETDSACASYDLVDFDTDPSGTPGAFRTIEVQSDGLITDGEFVNQALSDYGAGTHCVYIAFFADGGYSPCDGNQPTTVGEGAVIDNVTLTDGTGTYTEDFDGTSTLTWTTLDMADPVPFGTWARLFQHVTDNDICSENTTCAWLWTDHDPGTLFNDPSMAFGPSGFVIKNWLDDIIESPWISLASTPTATGTILQMDRFPGNFFSTGRAVQNWSVRGRGLVDATFCVSGWGHSFNWNSLSTFRWQIGLTWDMSSYFDPTLEDIQIRLRVSDWQWIAGASPPVPFVPGPGPYSDRIRIGRQVLTGPVINEGIDSRSQLQSCFPTEIDPGVTPVGGPKWRPSTDRFGTCAFSEGTELGINASSPNLITGDSIWVEVNAVRVGGDSITAVNWSGAIIAGPHAGKAPPPYTVGANGFFTFAADSVRSTAGTPLADYYQVSLDDTYFRGGDHLVYFWSATDNGGGYSSDPVGLSGPPASIDEAQEATQGMLQASYLPTINWDPAYIARMDGNGDIDPTPEELANSTQQNCILLYNSLPTNRRRSGKVNRTSFMYALDKLGYEGHYDVYNHQGYGNTNNQLGGRATIEQCQGYNLLVMDTGNRTPGNPILPDGVDIDAEKIDQAGWFSAWLGQASLSEAEYATLWIIGTNVVEEKSGVSGSGGTLLNTDMGVTLSSTDQGLNVNPDVVGQASFTFDNGAGSSSVNFAGDFWTLNGGCPIVRNYDGLAVSSASAVATHAYRSPTLGTIGDAAIVMNRNDGMAYNTIMQSHPYFDMRDPGGTPSSPSPELDLLSKILGGVLPPNCLQSPSPTDVGEDNELDVPAQTALHQNVPNPFNPTTQISFDLAQNGRVALRIYDVAGRLVRTLVDKDMSAGRNQSLVWNGLDDQNRRVSSGVYFYRLDAAGVSLTKKMVVMK